MLPPVFCSFLGQRKKTGRCPPAWNGGELCNAGSLETGVDTHTSSWDESAQISLTHYHETRSRRKTVLNRFARGEQGSGTKFMNHPLNILKFQNRLHINVQTRSPEYQWKATVCPATIFLMPFPLEDRASEILVPFTIPVAWHVLMVKVIAAIYPNS